MDPALGGMDELWLRQVWFARLRWIVPPALVALGFAVEALSRKRLFAPAPVLLLALALLALNLAYTTLLRRWAADTEAHARGLAVLGHAQVLLDLVAGTIALHVSGGARSNFWPFLALPVMAAALLFASRRLILLYTSAA